MRIVSHEVVHTGSEIIKALEELGEHNGSGLEPIGMVDLYFSPFKHPLSPSRNVIAIDEMERWCRQPPNRKETL